MHPRALRENDRPWGPQLGYPLSFAAPNGGRARAGAFVTKTTADLLWRFAANCSPLIAAAVAESFAEDPDGEDRG